MSVSHQWSIYTYILGRENKVQQTRLSSLSLLCIESGLLQYLDTNSIIDKFSIKKSRKKLFWNPHSLMYFMCYQNWLCLKLIVFLSLFPYIRCRWYKSNDVLHCVEIRISYIIILWYYVVFVDIWLFKKITVKYIYIYIGYWNMPTFLLI